MQELREKLEALFHYAMSRKANQCDVTPAELRKIIDSLPSEPFAVVTEREWKAFKSGSAFALWSLEERLKIQFDKQPTPRRRFVFEETGEYRKAQVGEWIQKDEHANFMERVTCETIWPYKIYQRHTEVFRNGEWVKEGE